MEESKEIQSIYSIFRVVIYVSLVVEFFEYACNPELLDTFAGVLTDLHERMGRWVIYQPGHLAYSKIATLLLVIITCIGTRNKKQIEFDARRMVFWPIVIGFVLVVLSVWLYYTDLLHYRLWIFLVSIWLYMVASIIGNVGSGRVYDGTFTVTLTDGDGVTAALLKANGIEVIGETQAAAFLNTL